MKRSIIRSFAAVAAAMTAATTFADTVAWWHFDECDPGTTAPADTVASDQAPNTYAHVYTIGTYDYMYTLVENGGDYLPTYTKPFPSLAVYDPVSGNIHTNHAAMKFRIDRGGPNANANDGRARFGGALKFDGGSDLYQSLAGTSAFTVEAFICTTGGAFNVFAPIVGCVNGTSWTSEYWALYLDTNDTVAVRFGTETKTDVWYSGNGGGGKAKVTDGAWHHVALTYDGTKIYIYVDHALDRSYNKTGAIATYGNNTATWIGGYAYSASGSGSRKFPGVIDEVRVSNATLDRTQFLRMHPFDMDSDELLRLTFEPYEYGLCPNMNNLAVALGPGYQKAFMKMVGGSASFDAAEKAGATMADGIYSIGADNAASYFQMTDGSGNANYIRSDNMTNILFPEGAPDPTNLNYTVEAFFKANVSAQTRRTIFKMGSDYLPAQVITGDAGHLHQLSFCAAYGSGKAWKEFISHADKPYDDGEWHHVAVVSDASNNVIRFYYDYALVAATNAYVPVKKNYPICVAGRKDSNNTDQFFNGWIDDMRVMKRALRPEEFLTTHAVGSASPRSLLLARFEQNYDFVCEAEAALSVTGTGSARPNGNVPTFEKVSPGALLLDGSNGTERVANDYSVHLNKSRVVFPISRLYENEAYTVEFWAKFTGFDGGRAPNYSASGQHAGILRFVQGNTTTLDWYLYRPGDQLMTMQMAVRNADGTIPSSNYLTWNLPNIVADSKWHHYALLFKPTDGNSKTAIELYYDYQPCGTKTINSLLHFNPGGHRLMVGESSTDSMPNILGYVNALRLSRGTLAPEMFLGRVDREKYPDAEQEYRFELMDIESKAWHKD